MKIYVYRDPVWRSHKYIFHWKKTWAILFEERTENHLVAMCGQLFIISSPSSRKILCSIMISKLMKIILHNIYFGLMKSQDCHMIIFGMWSHLIQLIWLTNIVCLLLLLWVLIINDNQFYLVVLLLAMNGLLLYELLRLFETSVWKASSCNYTWSRPRHEKGNWNGIPE